MKHWLIMLGVMVAACAPAAEPTPGFERAPSLAPSPTVLPVVPEDNPDAFVGRSDPTAASLAAEGHPSQDPSLAPQATEQSIPITVVAEDGTVLSSRYFGASAGVTLLLLHDEDGDTTPLLTVSAALQGSGFNGMVLSLRGYPPSRGQVDWASAADDARSAIDSLLTLPNATQVVVLGTGRSASTAMRACGGHPQCAAAILVNPVPDPASDPLETVASELGGRPLLILMGQDRAESQQTAQIIQAHVGGSASLQAFPVLDQSTMTAPLVDWLLSEFSGE